MNYCIEVWAQQPIYCAIFQITCIWTAALRLPTWETGRTAAQVIAEPLGIDATGLFSFFVEYKFSDSERKAPLKGVDTRYIGIIEREAWLTYKRLTAPNPTLGTYLDGQRTLIALFYAVTYAPDLLYANWEHLIQPIDDERAIRKTVAQPQVKSEAGSTGSGTPWINFDIRTLKPLGSLWWKICFGSKPRPWKRSKIARKSSSVNRK